MTKSQCCCFLIFQFSFSQIAIGAGTVIGDVGIGTASGIAVTVDAIATGTAVAGVLADRAAGSGDVRSHQGLTTRPSVSVLRVLARVRDLSLRTVSRPAVVSANNL